MKAVGDNGSHGFYTLFEHLLNNGIAKNSQQRKTFLYLFIRASYAVSRPSFTWSGSVSLALQGSSIVRMRRLKWLTSSCVGSKVTSCSWSRAGASWENLIACILPILPPIFHFSLLHLNCFLHVLELTLHTPRMKVFLRVNSGNPPPQGTVHRRPPIRHPYPSPLTIALS